MSDKDKVSLEEVIAFKNLSEGGTVEISCAGTGIKVITFVLGPNNEKMCVGRRVFSEKDLTTGTI